MEFRMLGPVEVSIAGRVVPLGGQKPKALFAALLVDSGKNLSVCLYTHLTLPTN